VPFSLNQFEERREILRQPGEHHYYDDGVLSSYYDKFALTEEEEAAWHCGTSTTMRSWKRV
jgi:hypothetical protein